VLLKVCGFSRRESLKAADLQKAQVRAFPFARDGFTAPIGSSRKDNLSTVEDVIYLESLFLVKDAVVDDVPSASNCQTPELGIHGLFSHPRKFSQHRNRAHDLLDCLFGILGIVLNYKRERSVEFAMSPAAPGYSHLEA